MRYKLGHKEKAREAILDAVGKKVRRDGFAGVGVDALAAEAGVTSGALYSNFTSKDDLLKEILKRGLAGSKSLLEGLKLQHKDTWLKEHLKNYLSAIHRDHPDEGCVLPCLTNEVARSSKEIKKAYGSGMDELVKILASGIKGVGPSKKRQHAWATMAMLVGALSISRALPNEEESNELINSVYQVAKNLVV